MYKTHTLHHGVNELKHEEEQNRLVELLDTGWHIVSTGSLPDRIVYVLHIEKVITDSFEIKENVPVNSYESKVFRMGVSLTKNGKFYEKGKGFIKKEDAYV